MADISGLMTSFAVHPKLLVKIPRYSVRSLCKTNAISPVSKRIAKVHHSFQEDSRTKYYIRAVGNSHHEMSFDNNVSKPPLWSTLIREFMRGLKTVLAFLAEQPSKLKYLEWPSFQSSLKTATLTLVLVALLIVALSTVDAGLSYLLALLLRRTL